MMREFFSEIYSVKTELKELFFDSMTENTKNNVMGVQYA